MEVAQWVQMLGLEEKLVMFIGYFLLVIWTLVAMAAVELKNGDFNRGDFGPFVSVFLTYLTILGGLEAFLMAVSGVPSLQEAAQFIQFIGYGGAVFHCFKRLLHNLSLLGLEIPGLKQKVESADPGKTNEESQVLEEEKEDDR